MTAEDTTTVAETVAHVAVEVAKELAITVAGCGIALALTAAAGTAYARIQRIKSRKSDTPTID